MPFAFHETDVKDAVVVEPQVFGDERGFFMETYKRSDFVEAGITNEFVQDNHSRSQGDVVRGLHFQEGKHAQAKLVRCTEGRILDVAVDLRRDSPTFGDHVAVELSADNKKMLFVPRGFAHGFATLSDVAEVMYKADNLYAPDSEGGIIWNDLTLDIDWQINNPTLSDKDTEWPTLEEAKQEKELF